MLTLSHFDYDLPQELIAQYPAERRGQSRLMVVDRASGAVRVGTFGDIVEYLGEGDALVMNDTKVFLARPRARKEPTGAHIELLLLREVKKSVWEAFVRPGRRAGVGTTLLIEGARQVDTAEVVADHGATKTLRFSVDDVRRLCWRVGEIPLPPYIHREPESADAERYQTVFASKEGAIAAPTAGLHFTAKLLKTIGERGASLEFVTLHIGLGTFQPLEHEDVAKNRLHPEPYRVTAKTARRLNAVRQSKGRVIAVGTTTLRLLETITSERGEFRSGEGASDIFIYPGHT
ncbi:MAG: tRNA preQ1(34) S-adenosylmethionine ribosyltransferase-isomerase QueA, partial [Planctomycetota bacterium]